MQVAILTKLEDGSFKPQKVEIESELSARTMLTSPEKFFVCTKSCNGTYHPVFSELSGILAEHKKQPNGLSRTIINKLGLDEDLHGKRFVVFANGKEVHLLGDVVTASKKLSK